MISYSIIQKSQLEGALRLDAEYYQPEYLDLLKNLNNLGAVSIMDIAKNPKRKFKPQKSKVFQYIEISEVDLSTGEYSKKEIFGEDAPDRAQWMVKQNDVIISTVRPIRNAVSLIREDIDNLVCSSGFAVLKPEKVEPEYLFIYLKSQPIVKLLDRKTTATMYPAVTIDDILNTKIYLGNEKFRQEIKNHIIEAQKDLETSEDLYSQAEDLLLKELGLKDFKIEDDLFYVVNLSEIKSAHRADAEYFQPKYEKLISKIKNQNAKLLGEIVSMKKGVEPGAEAYQNEGKLFIRVSSLSKYGIENNDQKYLSEDLYQKLKNNYEPKVGEILLTKDATPGIAYVVKEWIEGIISSGILRLKIKDKEIENEYLTLCLNSILGQMQAERDGGGSIITHWKPEQIKSVLIPVLSKSTQQKIADLVQKSHEARKKAKQLLDEAKRKIEGLIEKNYD
jgi:restriction endonuclease S subunit